MTVDRSPAQVDLNEDELALAFTQCNGKLRRVEAWGRWLVWNGVRWEQDSTLEVFDRVRTFLRSSSWMMTEPGKFLNAAGVAAVERLARADRRHAAIPEQFDADAFALNTPAGIVDLKSGELRESDPEAYLTKVTSIAPATGGCPAWIDFLNDVTQGDDELTGFLQRMLGYSLTGATSEHALFFLHGAGGNGKSTFLDTVSGLLGDYATSAPMETFTASGSDRHPTDLAMLRGARLVTAVETEEGRRWAESRIKALTGGDVISARFMRQDFFSFRPEFKLLVIGNHKPRLHCVDEAMRRRLHLVPFEATFKGDNIVKDMPAKLRHEWPQILEWMIEGCIIWQAGGLRPPERVRAATEAYFANQDMLAEWRMEHCETGPGYWETPSRLFASWRAYAKAAEYPVGVQSSFVDRMESAGFQQTRDRVKGRQWQGIRLKPDAEAAYRDWQDVGK